MRVMSPVLSLRFSLISAMVSSEIGLLSDRTLLAFGIALLTAVLIAVAIKSAYLSGSLGDNRPEWTLVDNSPEKWYYNATAIPKIAIRIRKVLKCDPKMY